jgi:hypothetical protein
MYRKKVPQIFWGSMLPGEEEGMDKDAYLVLKQGYSSVMEGEKEDNWLRGDLAKKVQEEWEQEKKSTGKRSNLLSSFLRDTNESRSAFLQYAWVSSRYEEKYRDLPGLTWTHYRTAAGTSDPPAWVLRAHDEGWSIKRLLDEIAAAKGEEEVDDGKRCSQCDGKVEKEKLVRVSLKRKSYLLCGNLCGITFLKEAMNAEKVPDRDEVDHLLP